MTQDNKQTSKATPKTGKKTKDSPASSSKKQTQKLIQSTKSAKAENTKITSAKTTNAQTTTQKPTNTDQMQQATQEQENQEMRFKHALAEVILLLAQSPLHKYMFLSDLEVSVLPALRANQYRLFRTQGQTIAFALWAQVSEEVHQRFTSGIVRLAPHEWSGGEHIWLMDIIAPQGKEQLVMAELKRGVFAGKNFMVQKFDEQGRLAPETIQGD